MGLDYHEGTIRVCVMTPQGKTLWNRDVLNDARVVRDRVLMFSPPSVVALEACCGAANFAEESRRLTQWNVKLANPSAAKGIGLVTAVTMQAKIGGFERFARGNRQADAGVIRHANHELPELASKFGHPPPVAKSSPLMGEASPTLGEKTGFPIQFPFLKKHQPLP